METFLLNFVGFILIGIAIALFKSEKNEWIGFLSLIFGVLSVLIGLYQIITPNQGNSNLVSETNGSEKVTEARKSVKDIYEPDGRFFTYDGHTYCFYDVYTIDENKYGNVTDEEESAYKNVQRFCKDQGGHLAIINSEEENAALFEETKNRYDKTAFFGLSDENREGEWIWVDGSKDTLKLWSFKGGYQQPDNGHGYAEEHYAEFDYDRKNPNGSDNTGKWNDAKYLSVTSIFICEWDYLVDGVE